MAYLLKSVTIRTNNTEQGMQQIAALWEDVSSGKLPILFDSTFQFHQGISPVSKYSGYESDQSGEYDLSILGVTSVFFAQMEQAVASGEYVKYEASADDFGVCAQTAWSKVWKDQKEGRIQRAFTEDYESTVPAEYTKDGKAHCYLYIAVLRQEKRLV